MRLACALLMLAAVLGCDESPTTPAPLAATFRVKACQSETFAIRLTNPQLIAQAESLIGRLNQPIVIGTLEAGSGGFNAPWSWHLVPESVGFADVATEVCDGCPHMVEEDLAYWVGRVGRFCPWTSRIVERIN